MRDADGGHGPVTVSWGLAASRALCGPRSVTCVPGAPPRPACPGGRPGGPAPRARRGGARASSSAVTQAPGVALWARVLRVAVRYVPFREEDLGPKSSDASGSDASGGYAPGYAGAGGGPRALAGGAGGGGGSHRAGLRAGTRA